MIRILLLGLAAVALALFFIGTAPVPPLERGSLKIAPTLGDIILPAGPFEIEIGGAKDAPRFVIRKAGKPVFETAAGKSPFHALKDQLSYTHARGMFRVSEKRAAACTDLTLLSVARTGTRDARGIKLTGLFACEDGPLELWMRFQAGVDGALAYEIKLGEGAEDRGYTGIRLIGQSTPEERFYGFGAQMSRVNFKGERFPLIVSEQGIGRGVEPVSTVLKWLYDEAQGAWHSTYAPVPVTLTDKGRGFFLASHATTFVDLRASDRFAFSAYSTSLLGGFLGGAPLAMITDLTTNTGRQRPLPDWVGNGAILGLQGGTDAVSEKLNTVQAAGAPITALWLQDWVGQRITSFGKQLWWSWTLDRSRYPGWDAFRDSLAKDDIKLLSYINPFLVDTAAWEAETGKPRRNLYKEALAAGYLIKQVDGSPYLIRNSSFDAGLLDLTNPRAQDWIMRVIKEEVASTGVSGWMADFGEGLPTDAVLHDGHANTFHNAYPDVWAHLNRKALEDLEMDTDALVFHRSGHFGSAGRATAFWLGDQLVTWDAMDGFKSAIIGHLSSGFSGHGVTHADIGGYTTITSPIADYKRSQELFMRWAEFAAFTPIFRTHEGNMPSENHQVYSARDTANHFAKMANLFVCLAPERKRLNKELAQKGWPIVRHPAMHYPQDKDMADITYQQILLGADIMMAPVTEPDTKTVSVTLPDYGWHHLWTGRAYEKGTHTVDAPIGQPAAFINDRSPLFDLLMACGKG